MLTFIRYMKPCTVTPLVNTSRSSAKASTHNPTLEHFMKKILMSLALSGVLIAPITLAAGNAADFDQAGIQK